MIMHVVAIFKFLPYVNHRYNWLDSFFLINLMMLTLLGMLYIRPTEGGSRRVEVGEMNLFGTTVDVFEFLGISLLVTGTIAAAMFGGFEVVFKFQLFVINYRRLGFDHRFINIDDDENPSTAEVEAPSADIDMTVATLRRVMSSRRIASPRTSPTTSSTMNEEGMGIVQAANISFQRIGRLLPNVRRLAGA